MPIKEYEVRSYLSFYKMPKVLFTDERYKTLSSNAKLMYMLLLDRLELSVRNKWYDKNGDVYQYYKNDKLMEALNCSEKTVIKTKKELADKDLLSEVRQGINQPNRLYISGTVENSCGTAKTTEGSCKKDCTDLQKVQTINTEYNNTEYNNTENNPSASSSNLYINSIYNKRTDEDDGETRNSYDMFYQTFPRTRKGDVVRQMILEDIAEFGNELYQYALKACILANAQSPNFLQSVLDSYKTLGIKTVADAEKHEKERAEKKRNQKPEREATEYDDLF